MEYLSLYKASFINDINEKELYNKRFTAPNTIHFPIEVNEKPSFLYLNSELLSLLEQIQILNTRIIKKSPYLHMKGKNYNYLLVI